MTIQTWQKRGQAAAPKLEPEYWTDSFKARVMEEEIMALRAEVQKLNAAQIDPKKIQHALTNAQTTSDLLMAAHEKQPHSWLGYYDHALNHADITVAALSDIQRQVEAGLPQAEPAPENDSSVNSAS